jgi:hypothetical protein
MNIKSILIYVCFPFLFLTAQSKIENLKWLEGNWTTEKWGGTVEEYWSAPNANTIIGMFRFLNEEGVQFTEHWMLSEIEGNPVLRLRHFNPDFTSWEEKDEYVEFSFVEMGENYIQFEGLRYELLKTGELKVSLKMKQGDKIETEVFNFRKM